MPLELSKLATPLLNRHYKEHLDVGILKYNEFKEANQVFITQCAKLEREGPAKTHQKPAVDVRRVYECGVFDTNEPATLQNKVLF